MDDRPCEKHDLRFCAECSGALKRHEESLRDDTHWQRQRDGERPPHIPGGPTIFSRFAGHCTGCGRRYEPGDAIHYDSQLDGWIAVECCAN